MCPMCRMDHLKIRKSEGIERLLVFLTGKRKFLCCNCTHIFRAADRRTRPRGVNGVIASRRAVRTS
jgi:hypothetical protein